MAIAGFLFSDRIHSAGYDGYDEFNASRQLRLVENFSRAAIKSKMVQSTSSKVSISSMKPGHELSKGIFPCAKDKV